MNGSFTLERKTGERVVSSRAEGKSTFPFTSDLTTAKRNSLPVVADDLGRNIVAAVVEVW